MAMMGAVLGVVGGIVQGIGAMQQYKAQAAADRYNAAVSVRNEQVIKDQAAADISDQMSLDARSRATMWSSFAANGLSATGSSKDYLLNYMRQQSLNIQRISYRKDIAVVQEEDKQHLALMGAQSADSAANISLVSGILGGVQAGIGEMTRTA